MATPRIDTHTILENAASLPARVVLRPYGSWTTHSGPRPAPMLAELLDISHGSARCRMRPAGGRQLHVGDTLLLNIRLPHAESGHLPCQIRWTNGSELVLALITPRELVDEELRFRSMQQLRSQGPGRTA